MDNINDRIKFINNMNIGDVFSLKQLMAIFKINGRSGMMKTNLLNMLVLTTSEENGIYGDSGIENGTIQYTGEGQIGDQTITKNNKTLYNSKDNNLPVYLFSKDKNRKYTFEGKVELYDRPYQTYENDIKGDKRKVWKFPLKVNYYYNYEKDKLIEKVSYEVLEIENKLDLGPNENLIIDYSPLEIRKFRKKDIEKKNQRKNKPDYLAEEIVSLKQGELNERVIFEREIKRLMEMEAKDEVEKMKNFFENKKDNEGYDIISYEVSKDGTLKEIYIEVKSTKGNEETPIDITDNELEFAKNHENEYYLYRIYNSDSKDRTLKIVTGKDLINNYRFIPTKYQIFSI